MRLFSFVFGASMIALIPVKAGPCVPATLTTYTSAGFSCEVNLAIFSDFGFFLQESQGGDMLSAGDITVSPIVEPGIVGLRFAGDFQSTGGPNGPAPAQGIRVNDYRFFFEVTRPGSMFTSGGSRLNDPVRIVQNPLKFGSIFASNYASNDGAQSFAFDDDPDLTDFDTLNSERVVISADNHIFLAAGASAAGTAAPVGFASLSSADYLYTYKEDDTVIPEPGTWATFLFGLAALAAVHRHSRKSPLRHPKS